MTGLLRARCICTCMHLVRTAISLGDGGGGGTAADMPCHLAGVVDGPSALVGVELPRRRPSVLIILCLGCFVYCRLVG